MFIERGSTWNRWDFHVHTPYSILNNQFGFNPDPKWKTDIAEFDNYVKTLFTKAVEKGIIAIGITDYFCTLFKDKHFISIPVDDSLSSSVRWQGIGMGNNN